MKKTILLFILVFFCSNIKAQDVTDAVRYGMDEIQGTARFRAMGGAFGALGGDISAININPASSVIFNTSKASFSLGYGDRANDVNYFNGFSNSNDDNVNLAQGGAVFVYENANANNKWNKFSLGVAYDRTNDYNDNWFASATNANVSIAEYFRGYADGLRLDEISAFPGETLNGAYADIGAAFGYENQQGFLGFESFLIDPLVDADDNLAYVSNVAGENFNQLYQYASTGYNGKMAFNFSTQYDEKLSLGLNINAHFLNYERTTVFDESNADQNSLVTNVGFDNNLRTTGAGISFQLGSIFKVTEALRLGVTYNSPTWMRISEENSQFLQTNGDTQDFPIVIAPNVINIFPEYRLRTPSKVTGSLAYVFGDKGILSFDYSRRDFGNMEFRPTNDPFFQFQNNQISNLLGVANTYRFGGEYRLNQLSFRGGYRIEESPYIDDSFMGDLTAFSLGLGYRFGDFAVDLAFSQAQRETTEFLYSDAPTFDNVANLDSTFTDVILTLSFGL